MSLYGGRYEPGSAGMNMKNIPLSSGTEFLQSDLQLKILLMQMNNIVE